MYEHELSVAVRAVREACRLCRNVRQALVTEDTLTKQDKSPVTVADLGAQAVMGRVLAEAFGSDPLMAEEDADALREAGNDELRRRVIEHVQRVEPGVSEGDVLAAIDRGGHPGGREGRFWTMDPIDGTKGFIRGDQYAVALALIEDGEVVAGVLGCPNLPVAGLEPGNATGVVMSASRGGGAHVDALDAPGPRLLRVSSVKDPRDAVLCESVESGHTSHSRSARIADRLGIRVQPVRLDSQCKYAAVARGDASVYMRLPSTSGYQERIWDHAAGCIVVQEAGGEVTDAYGKPLDFSMGRTLSANRGILATNGFLHARLLRAVTAILTE